MKKALDHGNHRPGRLVSGRAAAGQGVRGLRRDPPVELVQHRTPRPHLPGSRTPRITGCGWSTAIWTTAARSQSGQERAARRDLQPGRAEPRPRELRRARIHRLLGGDGDAAAAGGHPRVGTSCRFYQASSSEMFGPSPPPQNEETPLRPRSPYACAKVFAHQLCQNYREAYGMFICCGILFNHESPRRGNPVRDPQDHAGGGPHPTRPGQQAVPRQPRRAARLGLRRRLRRGDVAHAAAGQARRLRHRHR